MHKTKIHFVLCIERALQSYRIDNCLSRWLGWDYIKSLNMRLKAFISTASPTSWHRLFQRTLPLYEKGTSGFHCYWAAIGHMLLGVNIYEIYNLISRFKNFFDSLMSSSNAIVQLLAFNAIFNNTPIGLNRKFVSSRNSARTDENEKGKGLLLCSLLKICADHWYIPQFQRDYIDVLIDFVCTEYFFLLW